MGRGVCIEDSIQHHQLYLLQILDVLPLCVDELGQQLAQLGLQPLPLGGLLLPLVDVDVEPRHQVVHQLHHHPRKCHWWLSTLSLTNIPRVSEDCRSFIAVAGTRLLLLTGIWVTVSSFYSGCCHPAAAEQPSEPRGPRPPVAPCHGGGAWKPVIIWRYLHQYLHQYLHGAVRSCAAPRLPWSAAAARLAAAGAGPRLAMCPHSAVRSAGAREAAYTGSSPRTAFCADTLSWSCYAIKYRGLKVLCFF